MALSATWHVFVPVITLSDNPYSGMWHQRSIQPRRAVWPAQCSKTTLTTGKIASSMALTG